MPEYYDLLIKDATIVDGTGKPSFRGSVGVIGQKIVAVGDVTGNAARVIDATGLILSPGFVDVHSHADLNIIQSPNADCLVMQGITTVLGGNCAHGRAPFAGEKYRSRWMEFFGPDVKQAELNWQTFGEWLSRVEEARPSINVASLVAHHQMRLAAMGDDFRRKSTPAEVEQILGHTREAMRSGAFGVSTGENYEGSYADLDAEVVPMLKIAQEYGGLHSPHTKDSDYRWPLDDLDDWGYGRSHGPKQDAWMGRYHGIVEAVEVSMLANKIKLCIAHLPVAYAIFQPHPEFLGQAVARATLQEFVDKPREAGLDVTFSVIADVISASSQATLISSFYNSLLNIPSWIKDLSPEALVEKLKTREFRDRVKAVIYSGTFKFGMLPPRTDPYWMDCYRILSCKNPEYVGKTVGDLARKRNPRHTVDAVFNQSIEAIYDVIIEDPETTWALIWEKRTDPITQRIFLKHPGAFPMIDSASFPAESLTPGLNKLPILYYNGFPNWIDLWVKKERLLTLEEAIRKMTYGPAQEVMGLKDRGIIAEGAYADITIFSLDEIRQGGTFSEPHLPPEGIEHVIVNGQVAYEGKKFTGIRSGKVLRKA